MFWGKKCFIERQFVLFLEEGSVFRETISLLELCNGLANGAVQSKLIEGAEVCKGLEDVVGSVRGFLAANK